MRQRLRQVIHPRPYVRAAEGRSGGFRIEIGPPVASSPPCSHHAAKLQTAARQEWATIASHGEWVAELVPALPFDRLVDRDAILLVVAEAWLKRVREAPPQYPRVDARAEVLPLLKTHPVKQVLMSYDGEKFRPSPAWPDTAGHKVFLDRLRKLDAAGLILLERQASTAGPWTYLAGLTRSGLGRTFHLHERLEGSEAGDRLGSLLRELGLHRTPSAEPSVSPTSRRRSREM